MKKQLVVLAALLGVLALMGCEKQQTATPPPPAPVAPTTGTTPGGTIPANGPPLRTPADAPIPGQRPPNIR